MGTPSFLIKNTTSSAALNSEESGAFRAMGLDIGCAPVFRNRQPTLRFAGTPGRLPFLLPEADFLPLGRALFRGGPNHSSLVLRKDDGCIRTDADVATNRHSVHPNATCINIKRRPVSKIRVVDCGIGIHPNAPSTATRES